ncbi:hypothetical protein Hanom_Chr06g00574401 [Helianthus anomalus]
MTINEWARTLGTLIETPFMFFPTCITLKHKICTVMQTSWCMWLGRWMVFFSSLFVAQLIST